MELCHQHNLTRTPDIKRRYGVRVSLKSTDPLSQVLGEQFDRTHWFETPVERDRALADMAGEHLYSRRGDRPSLRFEAVDRS